MLTPASLAKIKEVPIIDIISKYVKLSKHGKASCPFHNEKSASFSVNEKKNIFKCFGCGKAGDGIGFLREHKRLSFLDAVTEIAEIGKVEVEYDRKIDKEAYKKSEEEKGSLRAIISDAQQFFLHTLWADPRGAHVLTYLRENRGFHDETIVSWGLGYAPAEMRSLSNKYAQDARLPIASKAGLVKEGEKGFRDFYINRVMFPITNQWGEIVSFSGRQLPPIVPEYGKYINGPATSMYDKSRTLYGLYQAAPSIAKLGYAILVEGNTDVISMHAAGATNTVASCGTEFTEAQADLLKKHTNTVVVIPDQDTKPDGTCPGLAAAEKSIRLLLSKGFNAQIHELPSGADGQKQDPDDFAKSFITETENAAE
jgi:DNA primase